MPEYVLNRKYALRSLNGHIISFEKGVPVWVPPEVEKEALHIGAVPVDGPKDILDPEEELAPVMSAGERKDKIFAAFKALEARNERGDFTGQGLPNLTVLEKTVGFEIHSKERDTLWAEHRQGDE